MTDANGLSLENIQKRWKHLTLEASFQVAPTERIAIVGRSGAGKSSLLRLIAGLEKLDQGNVLLKGRNLSDLPPSTRAIGFLFQDHALFPSMTVGENVAFGLKMRGHAREERRESAFKWLDRVGLIKRADDSVDQLSGGERQRVALARALAIQPDLLILDEPFTGLDPALKKDLISQLLELHRERPIPFLMVTHDESDVALAATGELRVSENNGVRVFRRQ
jgi:ABC-type Fe3+/spermidine/putrescine transport system ATPase subunit